MVNRAKKTIKMKRMPPTRKAAAMKPAKKTDKAPPIAVRRNVKADDESKKLFLDHHLPQIARLKDLANRAQANLRNGLKAAKKDGFLQRDFDVAFRLKTETGERAIKAEIARDMTIAKWLGFSLGKQLDMFVQEEEHDVEMMAYVDGEEASRAGKPASPIYAPETPGYEAYMRGFHDHQEELSKGFKKKDEGKGNGAQQQSGIGMTRSQFRAHQTKQAADAAEERSLFTKRQSTEPETAA